MVIVKSLKQEGSWQVRATAKRLIWLEQSKPGEWRVVKDEVRG